MTPDSIDIRPTGSAEGDIAKALELLEAAEATARRIGSTITAHWVDVARIHFRADLHDLRREGRVGR